MSIQTIKLRYTSVNIEDIKELQKQLSISFKYAYNRAKNGFNQVQTREFIKSLNNTSNDSFLNHCAVTKGFAAYKSAQERNTSKVVFGGRKNLIALQNNKITKEKWKELRQQPIYCIGETNQKGNRKFKLNIENNCIIFKLSKNQHFVLNLLDLKANQRKLLQKLQNECELKENCFTINLSQTHISISFEQKKQEIKKSNSRYAGIDLNPNYIGLVICENNKVVYQKIYKFSHLNQADTNKIKYEKIIACKDIHNLLVYWQVSRLCLEDLNIQSKNHNKGKTFNKLVNNKWHRLLIQEQLIKRCDISGIYIKKVNAAYSSFVGNLTHQLPDALSSALEIARRGKENTTGFYPNLISCENLSRQWKDAINWSFSNWVELYGIFKSKNLMKEYRVSMHSPSLVFQNFISINSKVSSYISNITAEFML